MNLHSCKSPKLETAASERRPAGAARSRPAGQELAVARVASAVSQYRDIKFALVFVGPCLPTKTQRQHTRWLEKSVPSTHKAICMVSCQDVPP